MRARQQRDAKWNADKRGREQPGSAAQMDSAPVLYDDECGDCGGEQHGKRSCDGDRQDERQQRDGHQRLPEAEGGADERGGEDDEEDRESGVVHVSVIGASGPCVQYYRSHREDQVQLPQPPYPPAQRGSACRVQPF